MAYQTALEALADPTRRALFERLRRGSRTVGELARGVGISQPAASQHLRVLGKARLVGPPRREGTRRYYQADPRGLGELRRYLESMWDDVLAAFAREDSPSKEAR
jgi:DNA-binding transcriptional ArsR family regulator